MSDMDFYEKSGGDAAWNAWLELCSVAGVAERDAVLADGLRRHIENTMKGQVARTGCASSAFDRDDPVSHFDAYFLLDSSRKEAVSKKPLKQFLKWDMDANGIPLREVVCGKLFSHSKGIVKNIVRDWITTVCGWKCRTITQKDGTRKCVWDEALPMERVGEEADDNPDSPIQRLSEEEAAEMSARLFSSLEKELGLEKRKIALLLYVTANSGTLDNPAVLETLEVKKSRAYTMKSLCIETAGRLLADFGVQSDDVNFATALIAKCEDVLGEDLAKALLK